MMQSPANVTLSSSAYTQNAAIHAKNRRITGHLDRMARQHEDKEKNPRLSRKLSVTLLIVASAALVLSLVLYGAAMFFGDDISRAGNSSSTAPIELVVGNSVLSIPANVIRFDRQRRPGNHDRVELFIQWPHMTGYTNENSREFNRTGQHTNLIFLTIEPRSMSLEMSGRVGPIYSKFFDGSAQPAIAGLKRQKLGSEGGYIEEDLYIESNSPYPFVTRCLRPEAKIGTPFCIRDIHIGKDLMLTYRFHIKYLPDWMRMDQSIRNFFNAMVVSG